ncbi:MAG: hypothetical protein ACXWZV_07255 [Solirubrobacterales bacterium]
MRLVPPLGVLCVCLALAPVVSAGSGGAAKPKKVATIATLPTVASGGASGSALSHRSECKRRRTVTLRMASAGNTTIATARTNAKGRWEIAAALAPGVYYAAISAADRKGKQAGETVTFRCRAAKSAPATL